MKIYFELKIRKLKKNCFRTSLLFKNHVQYIKIKLLYYFAKFLIFQIRYRSYFDTKRNFIFLPLLGNITYETNENIKKILTFICHSGTRGNNFAFAISFFIKSDWKSDFYL